MTKILKPELAELRKTLIIVLSISFVLLMPWPQWIFGMCKIRFRLLNKLLSVMVEEVDYDIGPELDQAQVVRVDNENS